ncbi:hypothetical protein [Actinoallomurus sp. CA-150999]|uniref:hypothetical protein n=1 Tax=Actinoallomurus sp. CA-150999 TaxID=3239887 RepID=UPI003D940063
MSAVPLRVPSPSHPPHEASRLRRIRRYAVPRWMIEQATERRLAGDWRGACAAANVDIAFDLADIAHEHGGTVAAGIEDDLLHFAPDLLRWHLPRLDRGHTTLVPDQRVILNRPAGAPALYVRTPRWMAHGPQRPTLCVGNAPEEDVYLETDVAYAAFWRNVVQDWSAARHLWDVRHAGELRERCGGDETRAPFFDADGTPRTNLPDARTDLPNGTSRTNLADARTGLADGTSRTNLADARMGLADGTSRTSLPEARTGRTSRTSLPDGAPGPGDAAAHTEWVTLLHERGEVEAAFAAAGVALDTAPVEVDSYYSVPEVDPLAVFARMPLALTRLEPEMRRLVARSGRDRFWIPYRQYAAILFELDGSGAGVRARVAPFEMYTDPDDADVLPEACWRRLPDLDLLRDGRTPPEQLHPLVREALFPARTAADGPVGPPDPGPPAPVRVRCKGEWHEVASRKGALHIPHDEEEQRRESALRAFGGAIAGCFAVRETWASGAGRLPKALRAQRDELFARVQHGDAPGVLALLDAGVDPRVRDGRGRSLLHLLHLLDRGADPRVRGARRREVAHALRLLDHDGLLARLLAAGLDVEARDAERRTPLFTAICCDGSTALVRALLAAGARIDVSGEIHGEELSLYRLIEWQGRDDLGFITERIEREHPELAEEE